MPLRHGHAISIDMEYSATLANMRGLLSDEEHQRILKLFSEAGLSMDHHQFDEDILEKGTQAILKTRDGLLRAAVPNPLGSCVFLNDAESIAGSRQAPPCMKMIQMASGLCIAGRGMHTSKVLRLDSSEYFTSRWYTAISSRNLALQV